MMDTETLTRICKEAFEHWYGDGTEVRADFVAVKSPRIRFERDYDEYDHKFIIFHVSDYFAEMDEDEMKALADECVYSRYTSNDHVRIVDEIKGYILKDSFLENHRPAYLSRNILSFDPKMNGDDILIDPNASLKRLRDAGLLTQDEVKDIIVVWDPELWANPIADCSIVMRTVKLSSKFLRESIPFNVRDYLVYIMVLRIIFGFGYADVLDDASRNPYLLERQHRFKGYEGIEQYISSKGAEW